MQFHLHEGALHLMATPSSGTSLQMEQNPLSICPLPEEALMPKGKQHCYCSSPTTAKKSSAIDATKRFIISAQQQHSGFIGNLRSHFQHLHLGEITDLELESTRKV